MAAGIVISPTSGNIVHKLTAANISCTEEPNNDTSDFDADNYPTEPEIVYRFRARLAGQNDLLSNPFSTNPDGTAEWPSVLFPAAGSWTLTLRDTADDSQVATTTVVVS
jgi:hypothetical protein